MQSIYRDKPYRVTQAFGRTSFNPNHLGVDVAANQADCTIYPLFPGIMFAKGTDPTGKYVILHHPERKQFTAYWHLKTLPTTPNGRKVSLTTPIGVEGATGQGVTGRHTHVEVRNAAAWGGSLLRTGTPIDPLPFFKAAQGGGDTMTKDQAFQEAFITLATKWASASEVAAWKKSGVPSYQWIQNNAKTGYRVDRDKAREDRDKSVADFVTYRTRVEKELDTLSKAEIEARTNLENAERAFTNERAVWNEERLALTTQHSKEISDLRSQISELETENTNCNTHLKKAQQNAKDVARWTWQEHLTALIQKLFKIGGE